MIDWNQLLIVYGPVGAILCFLIKAHRDVVYVTIPNALKQINNELRLLRKSNEKLSRALLHFEYSQSQLAESAGKQTNRKTPTMRKTTNRKKQPKKTR